MGSEVWNSTWSEFGPCKKCHVSLHLLQGTRASPQLTQGHQDHKGLEHLRCHQEPDGSTGSTDFSTALPSLHAQEPLHIPPILTHAPKSTEGILFGTLPPVSGRS